MILPLLTILLAAATPLLSLPIEPNTTLPTAEASSMSPLSTTTPEASSKTPPTATTEKASSTTSPTTTTEEESSTTPLTTTTKTVDTTDKIEIMNTSVPTVSEVSLTIAGDVDMMNLLSTSNEKFMDHEVRWLFLEKTTHIHKEEESFYDRKSGKTHCKSSENRKEGLKVLRDNRYGSDENEWSYLKGLQM